MCSIKAGAMCLQGKGTFHWNQFLFIALPTVNNFSPLKAGRVAWAKRIHSCKCAAATCTRMQPRAMWKEKVTRVTCTYSHTHTRAFRVHTCPLAVEAHMTVQWTPRCTCRNTQLKQYIYTCDVHIILAQRRCTNGQPYAEGWVLFSFRKVTSHHLGEFRN